jgi:4'-phosphopantetheinyl transferase
MGERALPAGTVELWYARPAELTDAQLAALATLLDDEERARAARFRFERNRRELIATRALVRCVLSLHTGTPAQSFRWALGERGRPEPAPPCGIWFNASNHPELVVCALSHAREIGVDVEPCDRAGEIVEVASTVFSAPELEGLARLEEPARRDRAVSLWTLKEAYIKALGLGLGAPLREIAIDPADTPPSLRLLSGFDSASGWWLDTLDHEGFRIATAVRAPARPAIALHDGGPLLEAAARAR